MATIVVKRLEDALAAGDPVRAVVRETLLNQDGRTESITSPSQAAQVELMRDCYRNAALDPRETQYFEAHGTGTATGDPIEAGAVATVFQHGRLPEQALRIGSVKTNIGHTEVTSGLASIIKVTLAMEKGMIPASINFEQANKKIFLEDWKLKLVRDLEVWPVGPGGVKRASVNNFGYGGTNAHLIMESRDSWRPESTASLPMPGSKNKSGVLVLSAKSENACQDMVANLRQYLDDRKGTDNAERLLEDILYTLGQHRSIFPWVAAHRLTSTAGLDEVIKALDTPQLKPVRASRRPRIGMVFTGQGAQWHAMGRELITAYPIYKASLEEADLYLSQMGADWSLMEELHRDAEHSRVNDTSMSIPICVALQIALVQLLRAWDVTPAAVTSHSSGEIAAAYTVGALNLKSAMAVAYHRAVLTATENLHKSTKGGMVAVGVGIEQTEEYLAKVAGGGRAVAACINSPSSVTVAGDVSAVQEIEEMIKADGIFARRLRVDAAYHSHHMEPVADPYREALLNAQLEGETNGDLESIAYSSPVTGGRIFSAEEIVQPEYWVESMVKPVQFVDAFTDMVLGDFDPSGSSIDMILEVGPHTALGGGIKDTLLLPEFNGIELPYYGCLLRSTDAKKSMQDLAANLLREGQPVDLGAVNFPWRKPSHIRVLTDLPSYPWDHRTRHWRESRFNRAIRDRSQPPHDLLGSVASWANPVAPSWRHILRVDDNPWLRDHIVQSSIVYPGAGFICLAIEAMAQMTTVQGDEEHLSGFHLRDIDIQLALVVPDNAVGIEIQTSLFPVSDKAIGAKGWKNFEIVSVTAEGKWTQHAQGLITAETDGISEATSKAANNKLLGHTRRFDPDDFYANLRSVGLKHGPKFQNLRSILQSSRSQHSVATFVVADTSVADSLPATHVMHPTTLDSIVQAAYTALPGAGSRLDSAKVPRSIGKLWVSSKVNREAGHLFDAWSSLGHVDTQSVRANISVVNGNDKGNASSVLEIENLIFQSLGRGAAPDQSGKLWEKEVCNKVEWAPDMSLATPAHLRSIKQQFAHTLDPEETDIIEDLRRVCIYFIQDALTALCDSEFSQLDSHHKKYFTWLQSQLELAAAGRLGPDSAQWALDNSSERSRRIGSAKAASVNGEMVCQLGPHLAAMLRGKQPPLELMMQDRLLYRYYSNMLKCSRSFEHAATLLKQVVHKNPRARILEIGAGTGGETRYALPSLGTAATGGPLASLYHFTDVSAAFFEAASQEFSEWADLLQFDKLDIETDPSSQGFEVGSYDIVIACQVLHATKSMANTMANVRKLMKPGGTLLMVETTQDQVDVQFVFGLLPGWWLSEEKERHSSPSLSITFWDQILKNAGFTGIDLEVHDCESEDMYSISTIMSTSLREKVPKFPSGDDFVIVTSSQSPPPQGWLGSLQSSVSSQALDGSLPAVQALETTATGVYTGKICVFVGEAAEQPLLYSLGAKALEGIKAMATACKGLLWITRGGAHGCEKPEFGLAAGLLRALRNEYVGRPFLSLDLDPTAPVWPDLSIPAIGQVLTAHFGGLSSSMESDAASGEFEYAERNGSVLVPRIYKDMNRNKAIFPEPIDYSTPGSIAPEPFQQPARPLSLQVGVPGMLDTLAFEDDERPCIRNDAVAEDMVEIEPRAYGVNFRDVMVAMGQLEERVMGMECAGTITKVGVQAAAQGFAIGDSVMSLLHGPFASRVCVEWTNVVHMAAGLSFEEAASIPLVFTTAYYSLYEVARLKRGQSVLIHAAAGGVGQAAIMLSQHIGATIFATVGAHEKKTLLTAKYGIPPEHIFSSRETSFAEGVLAATDRRGVDVVLNSLAGPLLQASFNVVAPFGHFVEIGKRDLERNSSLEMRPFARHASFSSVDVLAMLHPRRDEIKGIMAELARLAADKIVRPVHPLTVLPMGDVTKAFRLLQAGKHSGKIVLSIGPQEAVPVLPRHPKVRLSANASYLLVGGVGGIGRSMANWMVEHGAKNLIIVSRSAGNTTKTGDFVDQIQHAGCRVKAISCDVSCPAELTEALQTCEQEHFPPVRGIVQGAMVLKVSRRPSHKLAVVRS